MALRSLEGEGRVYLEPSAWVMFDGEDVDVQLGQLEQGGYYLIASYDVAEKLVKEVYQDPLKQALALATWGQRFKFFEDEPPEYTAIIHMLPEGAAKADISTLVPSLYEGSGGTIIRVRIEEENKLATLKSHLLSSVATYRAAWVDQETKLELVVESNFASKTLGDDASIKEVHLWRRLPTQEFEGKSWVPFGRKPNVSKKRLLQILEESKERVITGRLALERV